jgi:hypothetical protein
MRWTLALPAWAWVILILFTYVLIKAPADCLYVLSLIGRLIAAIGNSLIAVISHFRIS